jgi:hypothetical protein
MGRKSCLAPINKNRSESARTLLQQQEALTPIAASSERSLHLEHDRRIPVDSDISRQGADQSGQTAVLSRRLCLRQGLRLPQA